MACLLVIRSLFFAIFLNSCVLPKQLYNHYSFADDTLGVKSVTNSQIQIYTYAVLLSIFISVN